MPLLARAVAAHEAAGDPVRAARAAVTLAKIELERSAAAVAGGWLDRAESLLGEADDRGVRAYLLWMRSRLATFGGDADAALELAIQAFALAERSGDRGLRALTLAYKGFYNLSLGRVGEGAAQQNHAAAIALSGEIDPITGSLVYCNILWSARTFADWERAWQWSQGFETWCEASFAATPGACDLHRAEILGAQGDAARGAGRNRAGARQARRRGGLVLGEGYRVRGDIHAMIGDLDAARADYAAAYAIGWDAEPGNAVLLFEAATPTRRLAALDRALAGRSWFHLQRRGYLLVNKARIAALGGRPEIWRRRSSPRSRRARPLAAAGDPGAARRDPRRALRPTRPRRGACSSSPASSGPRPGSTIMPRASALRSRAATRRRRPRRRRHRARRRPAEGRPHRRAPPGGHGGGARGDRRQRSGNDQRPVRTLGARSRHLLPRHEPRGVNRGLARGRRKGEHQCSSMSSAARAPGRTSPSSKPPAPSRAKIGNEEMADSVRWIRSYVVHEADGRIGTFCIYEARTATRSASTPRRVGMPGEEFYQVATTVIIRPDPVEMAMA